MNNLYKQLHNQRPKFMRSKFLVRCNETGENIYKDQLVMIYEHKSYSENSSKYKEELRKELTRKGYNDR